MQSAVSGHKFNWIRDRLADKSEMVRFDPWSELWIHQQMLFSV